MNNNITPGDLIFAFAIGMFIGAAVMGFMFSSRAMGPDSCGELDTPQMREDTALLDFVERQECNLFFNAEVSGGTWGFLDPEHHLLATGSTVRGALRQAQLKQLRADLRAERAEADAATRSDDPVVDLK